MSTAFVVIYAKFKRYLPIAMFFLLGVAFIGLAHPINAWEVWIMCVIAGMANGMSLSYYFMYPSRIVPARYIPITMAIASSVSYIGIFLTPYSLKLYQTILGTDLMQPIFTPIGITLLIVAVLMFVPAIMAKNQGASPTA